jgi:threonine dehydrogenase-like Zn-dependent dehydrogenase
MKAVCWHGRNDVRVDTVPDPILLNPRDAIVQVSSTAICGSDLHLYNGVMPGMQTGDILGHEFMGTIVEVGREVENLKPGDRVVVPFAISCGSCDPCARQEFAHCDNSNPHAAMMEAQYGYSTAGVYGHPATMGGYAGGQAEYVRVPFADVGPLKLTDELSDEQALLLADILPTAYQAALNGEIRHGDIVAVWGCGPVGLLTIMCAYELGAERVIAIDHIEARLQTARDICHAEVINYEGSDVVEELKLKTGGRGPDVCIDAVGMEAHGAALDALYDHAKQLAGMTVDRPHALRQAIQSCRKSGVVSIPGVYGGLLDKVPLGAAFVKSLRLHMGQTHPQRYMHELHTWISEGRFDPSFVFTHHLALADAPYGYEIFKQKEDECIKVILKP